MGSRRRKKKRGARRLRQQNQNGSAVQDREQAYEFSTPLAQEPTRRLTKGEKRKLRREAQFSLVTPEKPPETLEDFLRQESVKRAAEAKIARKRERRKSIRLPVLPSLPFVKGVKSALPGTVNPIVR
jgi:hypothetical protein